MVDLVVWVLFEWRSGSGLGSDGDLRMYWVRFGAFLGAFGFGSFVI